MNLTELRELADKATPGPRLRLWASTTVIAPFCEDIFDPEVAGPIAAQVNLDFAAACSPERIKALIAVAEAAKGVRECKRLGAHPVIQEGAEQHLDAALDALAAVIR